MDSKKIAVHAGDVAGCIFKVNNCRMNDDGTWDCSKRLKECFIVYSSKKGYFTYMISSPLSKDTLN